MASNFNFQNPGWSNLNSIHFDLPTQLMIFRTAYLKLMADVWLSFLQYNSLCPLPPPQKNDQLPDIYSQVINQLSDPPNKALQELRSSNSFKRYLPSKYTLPWLMDFYLINTSKTQYDPYNNNLNNGWHGTNDVMVIKLPKPPKNQYQRVRALAAYYEMFQTPFGSQQVKDSPTANSSDITIKDISGFFDKTIQAKPNYEAAVMLDIEVGMGIGGAANFLNFSAIICNMISEAWQDSRYWSFLTNSFVLGPVGTEQAIYKDNFVEFENPWFFNIIFEVSKNSEWKYDPKENSWAWVGLENNQTFLCYPDPFFEFKERQNGGDITFDWTQDLSSALSRYNATGPAYPFTCP